MFKNSSTQQRINDLEIQIMFRDQDIKAGIDTLNNYYFTGQELIELGDREQSHARYNLAIDAFSKAIELNPENIRVLSARAKLYARLGKIEESINDMRLINQLLQENEHRYDEISSFNAHNTLADLAKLDTIQDTVSRLKEESALPLEFLAAFEDLTKVTERLCVTVDEHGTRLDSHDSKLAHIMSYIENLTITLQRIESDMRANKAVSELTVQELTKVTGIISSYIKQSQDVEQQLKQYSLIQKDIEQHIQSHDEDILCLRDQYIQFKSLIDHQKQQYEALHQLIRQIKIEEEVEIQDQFQKVAADVQARYDAIQQDQKILDEQYKQIKAELIILDPLLKNIQTIESIIIQQKLSIEESQEVAYIEADPYQRELYHSLRWNLTSTYLASQMIVIGMVESKTKTIASKISTIIKKSGEFIPIVGSGIELIGSVMLAVDHAIEGRKMEKLAKILPDNVEMSVFAELLARKIITSGVHSKIKHVSDSFLEKICKFVLDSTVVLAAEEGNGLLQNMQVQDFTKVVQDAKEIAITKGQKYLEERGGGFVAERLDVSESSSQDIGKKHGILYYIKRLFSKEPRSTSKLIEEGAIKDAEIISKLIISIIYAGKLSHVQSIKKEDKAAELLKLIEGAKVQQKSAEIANEVIKLIKASFTDKATHEWSSSDENVRVENIFKSILIESLNNRSTSVFYYFFNLLTLNDQIYTTSLIEKISKNIIDTNHTSFVIDSLAIHPGKKIQKSLDKNNITSDNINIILQNIFNISDHETGEVAALASKDIFLNLQNNYPLSKLPNGERYEWKTYQNLDLEFSKMLCTAIGQQNKMLISTLKMSKNFRDEFIKTVCNSLICRDIIKVATTGTQGNTQIGLENCFLPQDRAQKSNYFDYNEHFFGLVLTEALDITIMG